MIAFQLSLLGLTGCGNEAEQISYAYAFKEIGKDTIYVDSSFVPPAYYCAYEEIEGKQFALIVNYEYGNGVHLISLSDSHRIDIPIKPEWEIGEIRTADLFDSTLYVFSRGNGAKDSNRVHAISLSGNYIRQVDYSKGMTLDSPDDMELEEVLCLNESPIQVVMGNRLLLSMNRFWISSKKSTSAQIRLSDDTFIRHDLSVPESYDDTDQGANKPYYLPQQVVVGNKLFMSYPASDHVRIFDLDELNLIDEKRATYGPLSNLQLPPENSSYQSGEHNYLEAFVMEHGKYGSIIPIAVEDKQKFVRLHYHPIDDPGGSRSFIADRLCSLVLFNADFEVEGVSKVMEGFGEGGAFATTDGVLFVQDMSRTDSLMKENGQVVFTKFVLESTESAS